MSMKRRPAWARYWPLGCPAYESEKYFALPWPARAPVLGPEDMCALDPAPPAAQPPHGLLGWHEVVFERTEAPGAHHVSAIALMALDHVVHTKTSGACTSAWALSASTAQLELLSVVWCAAMALLGYDMTRRKKKKLKGPKQDAYGEIYS